MGESLVGDPRGADAIERRTQEIGREIFAGIDTRGPSIIRREWWDNWVMDWSMTDERLKVQLFRFIDVLPMLHTPDAVAAQIQAYFNDDDVPLPRLAKLGAKFAKPGKWLGRFAANLVKNNTARLARRFIAGTTPDEVIRSVESLREQNMTFTMDLLGEATVTEAEADDYQRQYLDLLEALGPRAKTWAENPLLDRDQAGPMPRVNLSIKVSAVNSQFDPIDPAGSYRVVANRLREVFRAARRHNAIINLDMEQYDFKDLTLEVFKRLLHEPEFRDWPDVGLAMQAYLIDTERDLEELLAWVQRRGTPVWVRLVKGAYWDFETVIARQKHWPIPVWTQKWQSDACFERCMSFLMEHHRWLRPAVASHNVRSMANALALAEFHGAAKGAYELQMLYGMADPLKRVFVERGERLRIYTPFGKILPGMSYLVRRLLENTSNASFLRATFTERVAVDALLEAPEKAGHRYCEVSMNSERPAAENLPQFTNEPVGDFSRAAKRERMAAALAEVKRQLGRTYDLWIDGKAVSTTERMDSINPANPSVVLGKVAKASTADADKAMAAATAAFATWRREPVWRRAEALFELARRLRERRYEFAGWIVLECGKQWREADADVAEAIDFCEYYGRHMLDLSQPRVRNVPGEDNRYFYIPRGVCVVIAPWNFPLAILCGMTVAPLVAGNAIVMKPAEQSSIVGAKFAELLHELRLPNGVVNLITGLGEEVGAHLVAHHDTAVVTFTGSVPVGLAINRAAAATAENQSHVKKVIAEMGGKNAAIVDDDADLDEAVKGVLQSAFGYQGQKCSACSRAIVLPAVYDAFVSRLVDAAKSLSIGPPEDPAFAIGPVIDKEAYDRLQSAIARGKSESKLLFPDKDQPNGASASGGYFIAPHVFVDVKPEAYLAQTELFGPVLAVIRAANIDEALAIANGTKYALTGGIFSRNPRTIAKVCEEFQVGNLYVNRKITGAEVDRQPFGGFKMSGIGAKAGGPDYLLQFLVPRTVTENTLRRGFAPE